MADSPSHSDVRQALQAALSAADRDKGADLLIRDFGSDWVVFSDPDTDGPGLKKQSYRMENGKAVLTGKATPVTQKTSYEPQDGRTPLEDQPKNLREARPKAREMLAKARQQDAS